MTDTETRTSMGKTIAIVVLVAIITGVIVTLVQVLIRGNANAAVTGGVVGAVTAITAITVMKKKAS